MLRRCRFFWMRNLLHIVDYLHSILQTRKPQFLFLMRNYIPILFRRGLNSRMSISFLWQGGMTHPFEKRELMVVRRLENKKRNGRLLNLGRKMQRLKELHSLVSMYVKNSTFPPGTHKFSPRVTWYRRLPLPLHY